MIARRDLLAAGLLGGASTILGPIAHAAPTTTLLRIQHNALQFSDSDLAHRHDADAVFAHARRVGNVLVSGTESGRGNSLWTDLPAAAARHGFALFHTTPGEWVAVDRRFGTIGDRGAVPVYPARGGHAARAIAWIRVEPHDRRIGWVVFGVGHWLTRRSLLAENLGSNARMAHAVNRWARLHGTRRRLVFYAADSNLDDRARDLFLGGPLTTCWDEIRSWPGTRHTGRTIDAIASFDWDRRVECRWAHALGDRRLFLASDHDMVEAGYRVRLT